jgi:hypothetical protein
LRDLTRERVHVLEDLNRAKNRIEQWCQTGNIKVSSVATDLFAVSGRRMLKAIVDGKRDAGWMETTPTGNYAARKTGTGTGAIRRLHRRPAVVAEQGIAAGGVAGTTGRGARTGD